LSAAWMPCSELLESIKPLRRLDQLKERSRQRYVSPYHIASIYAAMSNREEALKWLEKGYRERLDHLLQIQVDPAFDSLRTDPRFADLMVHIGFAR
jgi:hypothetical protein